MRNIKLIFKTLCLILLLPSVVIAEIDFNNVDQSLKTIKVRMEVIDSLKKDLVMQFVLPPQYNMCLFAAYSQSLKGNKEAHKFFLEQVDILSNTGLSSSNITGLISYGHATSNVYFAASKRKKLDELVSENLPEITKYNKNVYMASSCQSFYKNEAVKKTLKELIQGGIK